MLVGFKRTGMPQRMSDTLQLVVDSREIQLTSQVAASPTQRQAEAYRTFVEAFP